MGDTAAVDHPAPSAGGPTPLRPSGPLAPVLVAEGLTKRYGGVTVLRDVSLTVRPGEVRALLGENGAGKSTLIKILSGVVVADGGRVEVAGRRGTSGGATGAPASPAEATALGVATLHQELAIIPGLSVAENILLGHRTPQRLGRVRWKELEARATALLDSLGQHFGVRADAASLTPVQKTMVALARALSHDARLLVLDEPTAALTDAETTQLFAAMQRLTSQGVGILYVSHRLEEVMAVCSTYTVLRGGEHVAHGDVAATTVPALIAAMAGRPVETIFPPRSGTHGPEVLHVAHLHGRRITDVGFSLHAGEVLGIAGLAGSGRSEVLRVLAGAQRHGRGTVRLHGTDHRPRSVGGAQRAGVALVPQERRAEGLVPDSVERNANLTTTGRHTVAGTVVSRRAARLHAHHLAELLKVRRHSLDQDVFTLSGGNQQKVVLAKYLALGPSVLLLDEPTRGVDVATKGEIYHLVRERAAEGLGVIVVSSELHELLGLADRILVLHEGRVAGTFDARTATDHEVLQACYGHGAPTPPEETP